MSHGEQTGILKLLLKELSSRQIEVLTLVFGEGLTLEQAARAMDISVGAARTHYHRAKKKLGAELKELTDV